MNLAADAAIPPNPFAGGERFTKEVVFDVASIRAFATLVGDFNPLHHDEAAAKAGPFGVLIASGTQVTSLLMGLDATLLSDYGMALGLGFDFRFDKAIPAGAVLTLAWTITGCTYKPSLKGYVVSLEGEARDAAGTLYLSAHGSNLLRPFAGVAA
jgi:acyl dehydratase